MIGDHVAYFGSVRQRRSSLGGLWEIFSSLIKERGREREKVSALHPLPALGSGQAIDCVVPEYTTNCLYPLKVAVCKDIEKER